MGCKLLATKFGFNWNICVQIKADIMVIRGDPKEMIVEAVEDMHADLLVVGSRGLGQIKR